MTDAVDVELRLLATAPLAPTAVEECLRRMAITVGAVQGATHVDTFVDDADRSLLRHGFGLRLRRHDESGVLELVPRTATAAGSPRWPERESPWAPGTPPTDARELPPAIAAIAQPLLRDRPLAVLVRLEVERHAQALHRGGETIATLAIDRVLVRGRGDDATYCTVAIEPAPGVEPAHLRDVVAQLVENLPLRGADDDRLALALGPPPVPPAAPPPSTLGDLLAHRVAALLDRIRIAEQNVRSDGTAATVHELRVALRRARVVGRAFRAAWTAEPITLGLLAMANAARAFAAVRHFDVLLGQLPELLQTLPAAVTSDHAVLAAELATVRAAALSQAQALLASQRHHADFGAIERLASTSQMEPEIANLPPAAAVLRLRQAARAVRRRVRNLPAAPDLACVHEVRLALKRLRVLHEELAARPLPRRRRRRLARTLDHLGRAGDAAAMVALLADHLERVGPASPKVAALLGALIAQQNAAIAPAITASLRRLRRLDRRPFWRSLRRHSRG